MKKIISFLIVSAVIVAISFGIYNLDAKYKLNIVYDDIQYMLLIKIQWKESMKIIKLNDCLVMTL